MVLPVIAVIDRSSMPTTHLAGPAIPGTTLTFWMTLDHTIMGLIPVWIYPKGVNNNTVYIPGTDGCT